jgi:hypothetical protein
MLFFKAGFFHTKNTTRAASSALGACIERAAALLRSSISSAVLCARYTLAASAAAAAATGFYSIQSFAFGKLTVLQNLGTEEEEGSREREIEGGERTTMA